MKGLHTKRNKVALCALLAAATASGLATAGAQTPGPYYQKITSAEEIVDGGIYVITANASGGNQAVFTLPATSAPVSYLPTTINNANIGTFSGDKYYAVSAGTQGKACEVGLTKQEDGTYTLHLDGKYLSYYAISYVYAFRFEDAPLANNTDNWRITFKDQGLVHIQLAADNKYLYYQSSFRQLRFTSNSSYSNLYLYRKFVPLTFAAPVEGWSTFYTKDAYEMPDGVDGYAVCNAPVSGTLSPTAVYRGGELVPGGTPLLLRTEAPLPATLAVPALDKSVEPDSRTDGNRLVGIPEPGQTVAPGGAADADYYFYKLSTKNGTAPGFYAGAAEAGVFAMTGYNRAYLALPKAAGTQAAAFAAGFRLTDGAVTGIGGAPATDTPRAASVYTLSGLRLRTPADRLPAGLYIVDGKKVLVK